MGALILAVKFNEDDYFSNEFYSKVGGVSNAEFNLLENESFLLINHTLWITEEIYLKYENYLKNYQEGNFSGIEAFEILEDCNSKQVLNKESDKEKEKDNVKHKEKEKEIEMEIETSIINEEENDGAN